MAESAALLVDEVLPVAIGSSFDAQELNRKFDACLT